MTDAEREHIKAEAKAEYQRSVAPALAEFKRIVRKETAVYALVRAERWAWYQLQLNIILCEFGRGPYSPNSPTLDDFVKAFEQRDHIEPTDSNEEYRYSTTITKAMEEFAKAMVPAKFRYMDDMVGLEDRWEYGADPKTSAEYVRAIDEAKAEYDRARSRARSDYVDMTNEESLPFHWL